MMRGQSAARSRPTPPRPRSDNRVSRPGSTGASGLVTKGDEVEEWVDLHFFRPIGARMARRLAPTRVTADQVTLVSLIIGLAAGHLFVYVSPWLNAIGFVLFVISDLFDSADGQLARLHGTSTRVGRALDGTSDALRFLNLGGHLLVRLVLSAGWTWPEATALVGVAILSQSMQSSTIDFIRHAFLALAVGRGSEIELDAALQVPGISWPRRVAIWIYRTYSRSQLRMFPRTVALLRAQADRRMNGTAVEVYRRDLTPIVRQCAWLGQNFRFAILGVTAVAGWPAGLLWVTIMPMNAIVVWLRSAQERGASRALLATSVSDPESSAPSVIAIGSE
jgi:phosphatidylglycerophosphate synthase